MSACPLDLDLFFGHRPKFFGHRPKRFWNDRKKITSFWSECL